MVFVFMPRNRKAIPLVKYIFRAQNERDAILFFKEKCQIKELPENR